MQWQLICVVCSCYYKKNRFLFRTLMNTMSDFEFNAVQFVPYLEPTFASLFILLKEAKECDTKVRV